MWPASEFSPMNLLVLPLSGFLFRVGIALEPSQAVTTLLSLAQVPLDPRVDRASSLA
jgi:hypothetical protein